MKHFLLLCACLQLTVHPLSQAELVVLLNGDRITGVVIEHTEDAVVLETEYAGTVRILKGQVVEIVSTMDNDTPPPPVDVEKTPTAEPAKRLANWKGSVNLGFHWESDDSGKVDFRTDAQAIYEQKKHKLTLSGAHKYGETAGDVDTRGWKLSAYWQYYLRERLFTYTLLEAERDDARKLELRLAGTQGFGYDAIKTERRLLSLGLGVGFTHEEWRPYAITNKNTLKNNRRTLATSQINGIINGLRDGAIAPSFSVARELVLAVTTLRDPFRIDATQTDNFTNLRGTLLFEETLFERSKLRESLTIVPNLENFGEYRVESDLSYTQPLSKNLQFRLRLLNEYDSESKKKGIKSLKSDLTASLGFAF